MQSQSLSATETFSCAGDGRYKPIVLKLLGMGHAQQDLHEAMLQSDAEFAMLRALIQKSFLRKVYKSAASMQQIAVPSCQFLHNTVGLLRVAYLYPCCKARRGHLSHLAHVAAHL